MKFAALLPLFFLFPSCNSRPTLPSYGVVPNFALVDQSGRAFDSARQLDGKVWIANFIFTNCAGPCPRMTSQLRQIRDKANTTGQLRLVSFTIDAARDTPAVLLTYSKRFGADPQRWFFLTGPQPELHNLSRNVFKLGDVDGTLQHSTRFVLIDSDRRIRGYYDSSNEEAIRKLIEDIQRVS